MSAVVLNSGDTVGPWKICKKLGEGAYGSVYSGEDRRFRVTCSCLQFSGKQRVRSQGGPCQQEQEEESGGNHDIPRRDDSEDTTECVHEGLQWWWPVHALHS